MSNLSIEYEEPPEDAITDGERIAQEGVAEEVVVSPAVDGTWVVEVTGITDNLSADEFDLFVSRIDEIIEHTHDDFDKFYPTGQFDKSYMIRLWY